jgi:hypothetical protein
MHSKDKLAAALREAGLTDMAEKAAGGLYHDFLSPLSAPSVQLASELRAAGTDAARALLKQHMHGEFDATKEEGDAWIASQDGTAALEALTINLADRPNYALRPNAQAFDEVEIVTVPRYKQSGLSGDEWRISALVQFRRKGKVIFEKGYRDVMTACGCAYADYVHGIDDGMAFFGGNEDGKCDQEGCSEPATVRYRLKTLYSSEGYKCEPGRPTFRTFCDLHKKRGDCGLEDADDNYEPA